MAYLFDTNVLLRSADPNHPMYDDATNAISWLRNQGETLCIVPQNLIEFWNVYTRPANKNGLGHTTEEAGEEIRRLKAFFTILTDTASIYDEWERLVMQYQVKGVSPFGEVKSQKSKVKSKNPINKFRGLYLFLSGQCSRCTADSGYAGAWANPHLDF